jgi:glucan biosynthesis protein C
MQDRRYDIDWLRVGATFLLFPFHVGKVFDVPPFYHIKNADLSWGLAYFTVFVHQWHMPLFFVLAGWSLHASLASRPSSVVLRERVRRIFVPFLFGCLTWCAGLGYIEKVLMPHQPLSFLEFLPKFYTSLNYFTWGHLWFLIYLFVFTLLYFPLWQRLTRTSRQLVGAKAWHLYLPLPALILLQLVLRIWWPGYQNLYNDWGNFTYYSLMMFFGFLLSRYRALEEAVRRERKRAAVIGIVASTLLIWTYSQRTWSGEVRHLTYYTFGTLAGYALLVALLGYGFTLLNFRNRALDYLAESTLPVYILHQGGIVFLGYIIIHMDAGIARKFALLLPASLTVTLATYHFLVRPFRITRFLFGMKTVPPAANHHT